MILSLIWAVHIIYYCSQTKQDFKWSLWGLLTLWLRWKICEIVNLIIDFNTENFFQISAVLTFLKLQLTISSHSYEVNFLQWKELLNMSFNEVCNMTVNKVKRQWVHSSLCCERIILTNLWRLLTWYCTLPSLRLRGLSGVKACMRKWQEACKVNW